MFKLFKSKNTAVIEEITESIQQKLGNNLVSLVQYGSRIREKSKDSDINVLIILKRSTPEAHSLIHEVCKDNPSLRPFVIGEQGFDHSVKCFAIKLLSIKRNYKLLAGRDLLADIEVAPDHEKFLTDQAIRNMRLRLVRSFVTNGPNLQHRSYILSQVTSLFVDVSEVLRCDGVDIPKNFHDRITIFEQNFGFSFAVLKELYRTKKEDLRLTKKELDCFHHNLFRMLDGVILHMEQSWYE